MKTTEYLNAPVQNCRTCVHCKTGSLPSFDYCTRAAGYCSSNAGGSRCIWQPLPPKRSLRQWLCDTFWA